MEHVPYSELKKGSLLVASPDIDSGLFFRSVVLLCDHSPVGSLGLIINKSLDFDLPEDLFDINELSEANVQIRAGGPNQPNQLMMLHSIETQDDSNLQVCDGVYLGGDLDFLQDAATLPNASPIVLFLGYGGWGAGFLEREFLSGAWFLQKASKKYIFETPVDKMWQTILRDMGGKYKTLSMIPEDLDLN